MLVWISGCFGRLRIQNPKTALQRDGFVVIVVTQGSCRPVSIVPTRRQRCTNDHPTTIQPIIVYPWPIILVKHPVKFGAPVTAPAILFLKAVISQSSCPVLAGLDASLPYNSSRLSTEVANTDVWPTLAGGLCVKEVVLLFLHFRVCQNNLLKSLF